MSDSKLPRTNTYVQVRVDVIGLHQWPDAPDTVAYLRAKHRHVFVIRTLTRVAHNDRQVEFHLHASAVREYLRFRFPAGWYTGALDFGALSCEQIARMLVARFDLESCSVHEDDENGAIVIVDRVPEMARNLLDLRVPIDRGVAESE